MDIDPAYYNYLISIYIHGIKLVYAEFKKAVYGTLEASLLFWEKLYTSLEKNGLTEKRI